MASATPVTDHDEIRNWAESRGGHPACVKGTAALLRVDFDPPDAKLQQISWEQWFDTFESRRLAAMIQEGNSRFIKLVSRGSAKSSRRGGGRGSNRGRKTASARGSSSKRASGAGRTAKSSSRSTSSRAGAARKTASKRGTSTGRTAAKSSTRSSTRTSSTAARSSGKRGTTSARAKKAGRSPARGVAKKR